MTGEEAAASIPWKQGSLEPGVVSKAGLFVLFASIPFSISVMQIGLAIAIAGMLADIARKRTFPSTELDFPLLLFYLITLLAALASANPSKSLEQFFGGWTVAGFFLMALYGRSGYTLKMLKILAWTASVAAAYGIFQHFTGLDFVRPDSPLGSLEMGGAEIFFPRGMFSHYQTYSNVMFLVFAFTFAQLVYSPSSRERRNWLLPSLLLGAVLIFSYTRGIWLSTLFAVAFIASFKGRKAVGLLAGVVIVAAAVMMMTAGIGQRARTMVEKETNTERLLLWETTWNMIREHPLLGVGMGNYQQAQSRYIREEVDAPLVKSHSHNNILQITIERGIFALLIYLWMWYLLLKTGFSSLRESRQGEAAYVLLLGGLAGVMGFFIDGFFQNNFGDTEVAIPFWLLAGLLFQSRKRAVGSVLIRGET